MLGVFAAVLVAASGIDQMRQIELVDPLVVAQLQQVRQVLGVVLGQGEAQPDLDAARLAFAHAAQGIRKGPLDAAEPVVGRADSVN